MKILSFDIGTGTKDVLLYDSDRKLENCLKMVVPSPTVVHAGLIENLDEDVYIDGAIVGGGPLVHAAVRHLKKGRKIAFSPLAANAVKNDRTRVEEMGFSVGPNPGYRTITLEELHLDLFFDFLSHFGETPESFDGFAFAVQDHGRAGAGESDRYFRFNTFLEHLKRDPTLDVFVYTPATLPDYFMRMGDAVSRFRTRCGDKRIVAMDTCIAALKGCLVTRPSVKGPVLVLNCGNSHSMAAIVRDNRVLALFEHHTRILKRDPSKYVHYLKALADGTIDSEEIYESEGEGAFVSEAVGIGAIEAFLYTGPRRGLIEGLEFPFRCRPEIATPGGDMMMTGTVGLIDGFRKAYGLDLPLY